MVCTWEEEFAWNHKQDKKKLKLNKNGIGRFPEYRSFEIHLIYFKKAGQKLYFLFKKEESHQKI